MLYNRNSYPYDSKLVRLFPMTCVQQAVREVNVLQSQTEMKRKRCLDDLSDSFHF